MAKTRQIINDIGLASISMIIAGLFLLFCIYPYSQERPYSIPIFAFALIIAGGLIGLIKSKITSFVKNMGCLSLLFFSIGLFFLLCWIGGPADPSSTTQNTEGEAGVIVIGISLVISAFVIAFIQENKRASALKKEEYAKHKRNALENYYRCWKCKKDASAYAKTISFSIVAGNVPFGRCSKCGKLWCRDCIKDELVIKCPDCGGELMSRI